MAGRKPTDALLRAAVRAGRVGLWEWDVVTNDVVYSAEWKRLLGYAEDEIPDTFDAWESRVHASDLPRVRGLLDDYLANPWPDFQVEFRMRHRDGGWRWILAQGDLVPDASGRPARMIGSHVDITDRKRAEEMLHAREQEFRALVENSPDVICRFDVEGRFVYANPAQERLFGIPLAELRGKRIVELLPESESARLAQSKVGEVVATGRAVEHEISFDADPGGMGPHHYARLVPERDSVGRLVSVLLIARDITAHKGKERELEALVQRAQAREREFRTLAEHTPDFIVRWDRALRRTYVNPAFSDAVGAPAAELTGEAYGSGYRAEAPPTSRRSIVAIEERIRAAFDTGEPQELEIPWMTRRGERAYHLRLVPEHDVEGAPVTVLGIGRDITALKETERHLRSLSENSPDLLVRVDRDGRFMHVNAAVERVTGIAADELVGRRLGEPLEAGAGAGAWAGARTEARAAVEELGALRPRIDAVAAAREPAEAEIELTVPGGRLTFEVRLVPEEDDAGAVVSVLCLARDITSRKQTEEALRTSEKRFRQVTENIDEVFWLTDLAKREVIYVSPAYDRIWGRSCESLYADPAPWLESVHPEDRARVREAEEALGANGGYDLEYRIVRPDGDTRWIRDRAFAIRDEAGEVYRIAGVAQDVTGPRALEEQLRHSQKMEAVGQLAGGIAHDFNNLLVVIQMQSSLLLDAPELDRAAREGIQEVLAATERAAALTRQLLTFSRSEVNRPTPVDLAEVVGRMTRLLRRVLGEDIALETRFSSALPLVNGDVGMLEQVLMNLAINARDAMPRGGQLTLTLDAVDVSPEQAAVHAGAAPGRFVCLEVRDTGSGIPPELLRRVFEPFFTTKEIGRGTGLGLATAFGILKQHHGWLEVESELERGTTFRAFLPALERADAPAPGAPSPAEEEVAGGSETILLVEDEPAVRALSRRILTRFGYRVLDADSGAAALEVWEKREGPIDLLVTDLIMPGGMSGRELADLLRERDPALRVVYTSGYSRDVVDQVLPLDRGRDFLQKPYAARELAARVRGCLDA
jgi:PAS domain S-box-containing protein